MMFTKQISKVEKQQSLKAITSFGAKSGGMGLKQKYLY